MDFVAATDRLMALGVTLEEVAHALGGEQKYGSVKAARLDPDSPNYRRPPEDWRPKLARLAWKRGRELAALGGKLAGTERFACKSHGLGDTDFSDVFRVAVVDLTKPNSVRGVLMSHRIVCLCQNEIVAQRVCDALNAKDEG